MLSKQTTLVLGAGASRAFGFPLSEDLHTQIPQSLSSLDAAVRGERRHNIPLVGTNNAAAFNNNSILSLVCYLQETKQAFSHSDFQAFRTSISEQHQDSIDQFIVENPTLSSLGKLLLAERVLMKMYRFDGYQFKLRRFADREIEGRRNWYHRLIGFIRNGAASKADFVKIKLYVISFNYDGSIECALDACFSKPERYKDVNWRSVIEPLHINGGPSTFPETMNNVGEHLLNWSKAIHLIGEPPTDALQEIRDRAKSAISNSERIFIMGFQMDHANTAAIGLQHHPNKDAIFCHNFDGHERIKARCRELGIPSHNIISGSPGKELHIDELLGQGFLEL